MRFARMRSRVSSSGAWRRTSSSNVAFASSIIAQSSPPFVSTPSSANSSGSTWRSWLPSSGRPSESASRLAGSIVSTATFLPRAAIPVAIAAAHVVLPTPAEPAQMQIRLPSRMSATPAMRSVGRAHGSLAFRASLRGVSPIRRLAELRGELADLLDPELWLEDEREGSHRLAHELLEAGKLLALRRGPPALAERRPAGRAHRAVGAFPHPLQALDLRLGESLRVEPVQVHAVDGDADVLRERPLESRRLVDGHLLGQGDDRDTGLAVVDDERLERLGLRLDRAHPSHVREGSGGLQKRDAVAGGGRVDDHEVVVATLLHPPVRLGDLPDLPDRDQLAKARGRRGEIAEDPRPKQQVAHRPHLELKQDVLAHRLVRVDRDRPQVVRHLDLVESHLGAVEDL